MALTLTLRPTPLRPTTLALALAAAFTHAAWAEEAPPAAPQNVTGQTTLTADEVSGQMDIEIKARGNVVVTKDDQTVKADWADYQQSQDHVKAGDQIEVTQQGSKVTGHELDYTLSSRVGQTDHASFFTQGNKGTVHGTAELLQFRGKDEYLLTRTRANTCSVGDDSWYLNARLLDLDYIRNVGTARDATLEFQGVPILYTPWIDFPLTTSRKSGLLTPTIKTGSNGFELVTPYYFNLAPNYDATLYPRLITRRGLMMGGEFRYLMPDYSGSIFTEQLPYDRTTGTNRYSWAVQHKQQLAPSLDFNAVVNYVSDDNYFKDFSSRVGIASNVNLERSATFNYSKNWDGGGLSSMLRVQRYQTLEDPLTPVDQPYGRLPQLTLNAQQGLPEHFSAQVATELTRFAHGVLTDTSHIQPDGSRLVAYPSVSWNYERPWGFLRTKLGVHYTEYQLDNESIGTVSPGAQVITGGGKTRTLPIFSADSGLTFERQSGLFGQSLTQTLEPRLYYVLIPTRDQSMLPNYDTSENDVGFAQLFTENRFSGQDRINGANQLTAAITNRFIDNGNGLERLRVAIGQRYYFRRQDIDLSGNLIERQVNGSDLLFSAGGDLTRAWRFDSNYQYSEQDKKTKVYDLGLRFNPAAGKTLSAHYRYGLGEDFDESGNAATLHQIDLAAQWPLTSRLYLLARENYSLRDNKTLESLAGIEYNSGCWSLRLVGQRYVTDLTNTKSAFFVQLEFKDLGNVGNDPRDTLRLSIPGYSPTSGYNQNTMKPSTL